MNIGPYAAGSYTGQPAGDPDLPVTTGPSRVAHPRSDHLRAGPTFQLIYVVGNFAHQGVRLSAEQYGRIRTDLIRNLSPDDLSNVCTSKKNSLRDWFQEKPSLHFLLYKNLRPWQRKLTTKKNHPLPKPSGINCFLDNMRLLLAPLLKQGPDHRPGATPIITSTASSI